MKNQIKKYAILGLIALNIFVAGAVVGGLQGYNYSKGQARSTEQAVQAALKSVPVAQASK